MSDIAAEKLTQSAAVQPLTDPSFINDSNWKPHHVGYLAVMRELNISERTFIQLVLHPTAKYFGPVVFLFLKD